MQKVWNTYFSIQKSVFSIHHSPDDLHDANSFQEFRAKKSL